MQRSINTDRDPKCPHWRRGYYFKPSFLYPAASAYQFANGTIHRFNHGRFIMYLASEGADMIASQCLANWMSVVV